LDRSLNQDARQLLASARAVLRELVEEGVDTFEASSAAFAPAPIAQAAPATLDAPIAQAAPATSDAPIAQAAPAAPNPAKDEPRQAPEAVVQQTSLLEAPAWGPTPTLAAVREALGDCTRCGLCSGRKTIVFGDGNPQADLMFIGEGPGEQEDRRGVPFVGRAGELLTQMIERGLEIARSEVYICNIVKCRPPGNRNPLPDEVSACRPFLDGQIDAVRPKVIIALGKPAASLLLGRDVAITRIRGTWHSYRGIPLMPTFHPAFILRQYTQQNRRLVWEDLKSALAKSRE
jgi:DNA polymerase